MSFNRDVENKINKNLSSHTQSSSFTPQFFNDGVGLGNVSIRLSNISAENLLKNLNILRKKFLITAGYLISAGVVKVEGNRYSDIYFKDSSHQTDYWLKTLPSMQEAQQIIRNHDCNVTTDGTTRPVNYELVDTWGGNAASLFRGLGQAAEGSTESCLKVAIDSTYKKVKHEHQQNMIVVLSVLGGLVVLACLIATLGGLINRCSRSDADVENPAEREPLIQNGNVGSLDQNANVVDQEIGEIVPKKEKQKKLTFAERLAEPDDEGVPFVDYEDIPKEFLDPYTLEIMENPVIMADAQTADRSSVENALRKDPNAKCLVDLNKKIKEAELIPNIFMKKSIEAYVTEKEEARNKKQQEKQEKGSTDRKLEGPRFEFAGKVANGKPEIQLNTHRRNKSL